ncbi:MAG TPA: cytidylate kinase-like family protein [Candidatus Acidoferrales bacterium]|nr:cytidylate kinase-like family protein [Candidatus Acidoferrales bacterium]
MNLRILTIEREYGSGGAVIASELARRLGWKLWDHAITEEIAKLARVSPAAAERHDERRDPLLYRLAKVFARGSNERTIALDDGVVFDAERMVDLLGRVIRTVAGQGESVIVGRGAAFLLRGRPDAFHVFVYAPRDVKIARIMTLGKSPAEAAELVETVDKERAAFIQQYFGADWPTRYLYHLSMNSAPGDAAVVETILQAMNIHSRYAQR